MQEKEAGNLCNINNYNLNTYEVSSFKLSVFMYLSFILHTTTKASIIIPSLRLGKLTFREIRWLAKDSKVSGALSSKSGISQSVFHRPKDLRDSPRKKKDSLVKSWNSPAIKKTVHFYLTQFFPNGFDQRTLLHILLVQCKIYVPGSVHTLENAAEQYWILSTWVLICTVFWTIPQFMNTRYSTRVWHNFTIVLLIDVSLTRVKTSGEWSNCFRLLI